jgi:uncharacterized membrane protein HdeD (DUF308 family)
MVAGAITTAVGIGIVLMRELKIPGYWMPVFVGLGLLVAGIITWVTSREVPR